MKREDFIPFLKKLNELIQAGKVCLIRSEGEEQYIAEVSKSEGGYVVNILLQVVSAMEREMKKGWDLDFGSNSSSSRAQSFRGSPAG